MFLLIITSRHLSLNNHVYPYILYSRTPVSPALSVERPANRDKLKIFTVNGSLLQYFVISSMSNSQQTQPLKSKTANLLLWIILVPFFFLLHPEPAKAANPFPLYHVITKNVAFWSDIYSKYSLNQAVIHDSEDLSKIYEIINLIDYKIQGASRLNRIKEKKARKKYKNLLLKLSRHKPVTSEEKRIAAMFSGPDKQKKMRQAAPNVRSQSGQKERFIKGVIRSGKYMREIKRIFRSYGLPEDLSYLPHVESSFNTNAYSKFGAAGIWQFTRSTGRQYLKINNAVDERLDPILATHAAARYLKKSYGQLNHWPLAITSYNYGLAGALRAQNELQTYTKIFESYNKGHFKFASKNFYSEFLAARNVAKQLEKKLSLTTPLKADSLKLGGYAEISDILYHFRVTSSQLAQLNPALRPTIFSGEKRIPKGYVLKLPATQKIAARIVSMPRSIYYSSQKKGRFHRVKRGETAGAIAKKYGVSLKKLRQVNSLNKYATIYTGQSLRLPDTVKKTRRQSKLPTGQIQKIKARPKQRIRQGEDTPVPIITKTRGKKTSVTYYN